VPETELTAHVNPYGKFSLDMERHLDLGLSGRGSD
jgi:hypothetical protein